MVDGKDRSPDETTRRDRYIYRRRLKTLELIPAIGVGIVTGLAAFYVAKLFLERAPLLPEEQRMGRYHASRRATG
jgi:hypothetical protein